MQALAPAERGPGEDLSKTAEHDEEVRVQKSKEELAREAAEAAKAAEVARLERREDQRELFALCTELGEKAKVYDAHLDAMVDTFLVGKQVLQCMRQILR